MREQVLVKTWDWWNHEYVDKSYPRLTKEELLKCHPKYIFKSKDMGISHYNEYGYVYFKTPENLPKDCGFTKGEYGVLVKDYQDALREIPHYPNKKEGKALRRAKAKKGR